MISFHQFGGYVFYMFHFTVLRKTNVCGLKIPWHAEECDIFLAHCLGKMTVCHPIPSSSPTIPVGVAGKKCSMYLICLETLGQGIPASISGASEQNFPKDVVVILEE